MTLSRIGRFGWALVVSVAVGLGMSGCAVGTIGYMWVLGTNPSAAPGQQSGQIAGFKIDDYTGNLTSAVRSPFAAGGTNPVSIVVKPGGRYVYVVNEGVPGSGTCASPSSDYVAGNISVFSVGGDGTLTFQSTYNSQGCTPVWAAIDSTGGFLYVLDQKAPVYGTTTNGATNLDGDVTVFSIASDTGRLSLVTNAQVQNGSGTQLPYFEVGPTPIMMRVASGCLYTVDQGDNTVFPYSIGTAGQLALTTNSRIPVTATLNGNAVTPKLTSISAGASYIYLTDSANNLILPYTAGSNCSLNTLTGGSQPNLPLTADPVYTFTESKGVYFYVLNQSGTDPNQPNSSISAFIVEPSGGKIQAVGRGSDTTNPYPVGSGPVCMAEDPTGQYLYTSNNTTGTVTGKLFNSATGQLSDLSRGSTFPAVGKATCLAVSPNVQ